jgi:hypothetical protein
MDRNKVTIAPEKPDDEYFLTRAQFSFSPKPCADSKAEDFGSPIEFVFANDTASMMLFEEAACMKTLDAWGKFK